MFFPEDECETTDGPHWVSKCPACDAELNVDECCSEMCFNCGDNLAMYTVEELDACAELVSDTNPERVLERVV